MITETPTRQLPADRRSRLRRDIEGIRALAIGLVLIFHAGLPLPGGFIGVDIFFVLSGFLITGILIREVKQTGRVSLPRFYARRAKRLLPAAGLVLVTTAILTYLTTSIVYWQTFARDIIAAAFYVVNWVLAGRSVDYLSEDIGASPVQHFWSLAVEEQFYFVWPLLIIAVTFGYRQTQRISLRSRLLAGILVIAIPSFLWSVIYTGSNPEQAFFVTPTRVWELAIGALVAIGATKWAHISRRAAEVLGWGGLTVIVLGAFLIDSSTPWPSYWALVPTLGTAAVIIAGFKPDNSCSRVFATGPAVWIGGLSYSLYLWHWPLLIAAESYWADFNVLDGVAVVFLSFVPAYLSFRFIENPIRFAPSLARSNKRALKVGLYFSLGGAAAGLCLALIVNPGPNAKSGDAVGAAVLLEDQDAPAGKTDTISELGNINWLVPNATEAASDIGPATAECQLDEDSSEPRPCEYGDLDADTTIAVVGDSKVRQYLVALDEIGKRNGIHFVANTKSACSFSTGLQVRKGSPYTSCQEWNEEVVDQIRDLEPDAVLTSGRETRALSDPYDLEGATEQAMQEAITEAWTELDEMDIPVIGILDNPSPDFSVYECVASVRDLSECGFDRREAIERSSAELYIRAHEAVPSSALIDIRDFICPDETCAPVIGNVLVYRQTTHITNTYAETLLPALEPELLDAIEKVTSPADK